MPDVFTHKHTKSDKVAEGSPQATPHRITILNEKASKPHLFSSFCPKPLGVRFETQEPGEEIILLLRRHFVTNLRWITAGIVFLLLPLFLAPFFLSEEFTSMFFEISGTFITVMLFFYYLVVSGYVLTQFATWFYQVGILTHDRVIDVDFHTLLSRNIAYTEIEGIVDVEVIQKGFLQGLFNYGSVQVQTEGIQANFEFTNIPRPTAVADTISDLMRERKNND